VGELTFRNKATI